MHLFWTTGIYYLYIISKRYEVTLALENCSQEEELKIIDVCKRGVISVFHLETKYNLSRHKYCREIAYNLVKSIKPDIIFTNDDQNVFNMYLLRAAKKRGAVSICYQTGTMEGKRRYNWELFCGADAVNFRDRYGLSYSVALLLAKFIRYVKHIWHYYSAPLMIGESPFIEKSSAYLSKGRSGMRDGDCFIVFSKREKNICISDGLCVDKVEVLSHPIEYIDRSMIEKLWAIKTATNAEQNKNKIVLILLPDIESLFSLHRETREIISSEKIYKSWTTIIATILNKYPNAIVWLKMHPGASVKSKFIVSLLKEFSRYKKIEIVSNAIDGMQYAVNADVIIGETSTLLYTVSRAFDNKEVISFDLLKRKLGDAYKGDRKIRYVKSIENYLNTSPCRRMSFLPKNKEMENGLFSLIERITNKV